MELKHDYWRGNFNDVKISLIKSIAQYIRRYSTVKIGITSNPQARKNKHNASNIEWKKMIIKYETSSVNYINQMEKILIDHHWDYIANEKGGGGGPNAETGPYYLYVLLK